MRYNILGVKVVVYFSVSTFISLLTTKTAQLFYIFRDKSVTTVQFLCDSMQDGGDTARYVPKPHHKGKKHTVHSLKEEYEKKRAEEEKAKEERDAMVQAKREHREKSEAKRKELREKMFKKTRSGQPVMRYRIEHLLETALSK
jgi:hypothetical protein